MTNIPLELANARIAANDAWNKYDAAIGTPFQAELWKVVNWLEERSSALYREWQAVGGTSNIETIQFSDAWSDPRTPEQIDADAHEEETRRTRAMDYPLF